MTRRTAPVASAAAARVDAPRPATARTPSETKCCRGTSALESASAAGGRAALVPASVEGLPPAVVAPPFKVFAALGAEGRATRGVDDDTADADASVAGDAGVTVFAVAGASRAAAGVETPVAAVSPATSVDELVPGAAAPAAPGAPDADAAVAACVGSDACGGDGAPSPAVLAASGGTGRNPSGSTYPC
jgi:hypothetical protein